MSISAHRRSHPMQVTTIGVDLAKNGIILHGFEGIFVIVGVMALIIGLAI
jgi:hypothetical protein